MTIALALPPCPWKSDIIVGPLMKLRVDTFEFQMCPHVTKSYSCFDFCSSI